MAELLSHLLIVWAVLTIASWRLEWLTSRWVAVGVIGGILPDLNRPAIVVPERAIADVLGVPFQLDAIHLWKTLLPEQTTVFDKIVASSRYLLLSQPAGGRYLPAVRSLSGESSCSRMAPAGH